MKTLFNIIICGHNEILKRYNINEIKKERSNVNPIVVYNCNNIKDKVKLLYLPNKSHYKMIDNFDSLTKLQLKAVMRKSGCVNLLVTRLSSKEIYQWFYKKNCIELYTQLFPYLLDVDNTKSCLKRFTIVSEDLLKYLFK